MDILPTDGAGAPVRWMLVFRRRSATWWVNWLAWGEFKHVRAFAYVAETDTWVFYDVGWGRTSVFLARGAGARKLMLEWTEGAAVLGISRHLARCREMSLAFRPLICTTAVASLVGLRGALRPTALFHDCLRHGAQIVHGQTAGPAHDHPIRSPA